MDKYQDVKLDVVSIAEVKSMLVAAGKDAKDIVNQVHSVLNHVED